MVFTISSFRNRALDYFDKTKKATKFFLVAFFIYKGLFMFRWLFNKKKNKKIKRTNTFVCKHCKYSCETCDTKFCYSCYSDKGNPCPKCGKTNLQEKENS